MLWSQSKALFSGVEGTSRQDMLVLGTFALWKSVSDHATSALTSMRIMLWIRARTMLRHDRRKRRVCESEIGCS